MQLLSMLLLVVLLLCAPHHVFSEDICDSGEGNNCVMLGDADGGFRYVPSQVVPATPQSNSPVETDGISVVEMWICPEDVMPFDEESATRAGCRRFVPTPESK